MKNHYTHTNGGASPIRCLICGSKKLKPGFYQVFTHLKIAYLPLYLLISFFLGSCIDSTEQVAPESIVESNEIAKVKGWFETNKDVLEVYKTNPSYREFSKDLILPFFDKEPDWSNFSEYFFPDGRKVFEVNIKDLSGIVPVDFFEKYGSSSSELVEEALLFVEHTNSEIGYSIWVARYFSYGKKSDGMTYHVIPSDWSGRIDLFTFSEVHLKKL